MKHAINLARSLAFTAILYGVVSYFSIGFFILPLPFHPYLILILTISSAILERKIWFSEFKFQSICFLISILLYVSLHPYFLPILFPSDLVVEQETIFIPLQIGLIILASLTIYFSGKILFKNQLITFSVIILNGIMSYYFEPFICVAALTVGLFLNALSHPSKHIPQILTQRVILGFISIIGIAEIIQQFLLS